MKCVSECWFCLSRLNPCRIARNQATNKKMSASASNSLMHIQTGILDAAFDRTPLGFEHDLHQLQQFQPDSLESLARLYEGHKDDYFVAASAPTPDTGFYTVPTLAETPAAALARLGNVPTRVLLKRPENHDPRFRTLLDALYDQVRTCLPALRNAPVARLESAILITSTAATTPFHFDPEVGFFSQIEGRKTYHLYAPTA